MNLEEARSYVIFCREGGGRISAYIGLHLLDTDRRLFYPHSSNPFPEGDMDAVDEEARGFAEGLGAMLDEIDITKMTPEEKNHWIDDQAIFNLKKQTVAKSVEQTEPQATGSLEQPAAPFVQPQEATAPPVPGSAVSVEQPAPAAEPQETAAPVVPVTTTSAGEPASVVQTEPVDRLEEDVAPAPPMHTIPAPPSPEPPQQPPEQPKPPKRQVAAAAKAAPRVSAKRAEDLIQRAIMAGVVKAPKSQLNKEIRSNNGIVSRDKEALARLLSSF
jgi:hypothetical protein